MSLSQPIMSVLCEFASAFSQPTWSKMQVLIVGTLLARGWRTVTAALRQMMLAVRRWLPGVEITIIGDQAYSVHELGGACARWGVRLVAPLRMDAALYAPAPWRQPGTNGRPRVKGERLPQLDQVLKDPQTPWQHVHVGWYNGRRRKLEVTSGTAVWDSDWPAGAADSLGARARPHGPP